jgi:hypothetical protein
MIELTEAQRQELEGAGPARARDPRTNLDDSLKAALGLP